MKLVGLFVLATGVGCAVRAGSTIPAEPQPRTAQAPALAPANGAADELASVRTLVDESSAALKSSDYSLARAKAAAAIDALLARTAEQREAAWLALLDQAGQAAWDAQDARAANKAWGLVLEIRTRTLDADHPSLQESRQNVALAIRSLGDLKGARALLEQVLEVLSRTLPAEHPSIMATRLNLAVTIKSLGDLKGARALEEQVLEVYSRTLTEDDPALQSARQNLANTLRKLGDLQGARALEEKVLEVRLRTLPDDHPDLQRARLNLSVTIKGLGDLKGARALEEKVLEVRTRTLPDDHPDLQLARQSLANTLGDMGESRAALALYEKVLEVRTRTLPDDHPDLQSARTNLAVILKQLGNLRAARALYEQVLEVRTRTLPADHPDILRVQENLAVTLMRQGDLQAAQELEEHVLEVRLRTLPPDHRELQTARQNLAVTIKRMGDLQGARVLEEQVLEVRTRTLPEDHPALQAARSNLANTLRRLGDLQGARALFERVLGIVSRTRPEDHPDLQSARQNLAISYQALGDLEEARALLEQVLEVRSRTLPEDHPQVLSARLNLAVTLRQLGELQAARELEEQALASASRSTPEDDIDLQNGRLIHAVTLRRLGEYEAARTLLESVLEVLARKLPADHPVPLLARQDLALTIADQAAGAAGQAADSARARERCVELVAARCAAQTQAARRALLEGSPREAESRCTSLSQGLDLAFSLVEGLDVFARSPELQDEGFVLSETTRGAALGSAALMHAARGSTRYAELRAELGSRTRQLAALAARGTSSDEFQQAVARCEEIERQLVTLGSELAGGNPAWLELAPAALAARLGAEDAIVAFRRYERTRIKATSSGPDEASAEELCAFVLRPGSAPGEPVLTQIDLGTVERIGSAVREWRAAIGVGLERGVAIERGNDERAVAAGAELRKLVFDPLLPLLGAARHVVFTPDDELHLVPLDALPLPDGGGLVGDRYRIETRATLLELQSEPRPPQGEALVALGGSAFNSAPVQLTDEDRAPLEPEGSRPVAAVLRGTPWEAGFASLPGTAEEVTSIGALFAEVFEGRPGIVLQKRKASHAALQELAPRARWLHIATHGWYAPESIRSWQDPGPLDQPTGLGTRESGDEQVKGMSPMLLCGLAFTGANLPADAVGRSPGLVTAEEIAALDLSGCELAVLSACDTNVGERRAGQGVASLQMALQMAGARSVISSLWRVPDEATRELMTDFYRRLWAGKKPKWQALWEAKRRLREAKDERGQPKYSLRDWAGWMLTGDPN